jgi:hypothetical protein
LWLTIITIFTNMTMSSHFIAYIPSLKGKVFKVICWVLWSDLGSIFNYAAKKPVFTGPFGNNLQVGCSLTRSDLWWATEPGFGNYRGDGIKYNNNKERNNIIILPKSHYTLLCCDCKHAIVPNNCKWWIIQFVQCE